MAVEVFKSTTKLTDGLKIECSARNHKIIMDEPKSLGGSDTGMNPVEALLCSLGACQCIVAKCFAKLKKIDLQEFWIELEGDLDPDGFQGKNKDVKIGFQAIKSNIHIKSTSSREDIEKFVQFIEETCPVCDSLKNAPRISSEIIIEK